MSSTLVEPPQVKNVFVVVLEKLLRQKDPALGITKLDDRVGIHPQKVHRLLQPKFYTLNPKELDLVVSVLGLEPNRLILHASILATKVQELLFLHGLSSTGAFKTADRMIPSIVEVLEENQQLHREYGTFYQGYRAISGGAMMTMDQAQETLFNNLLEKALIEIDRGNLALHLLMKAVRDKDKTLHSYEAIDSFDKASQQISLIEARISTDPQFLNVQHEARERILIWQLEATNGRLFASSS